MPSFKRGKHLSVRERVLVTISALYAAGRREETDHVIRSAMPATGISSLVLEELFIHCSLVLGFPAMLDGLERLRRLDVRRASRRTGRSSRTSGINPLRRVYGEQTAKLLRNLAQIHPEVRLWILRDVYGKVFTRRGLLLRERELVNVVVLAVQGFERQLQSHLRGALRTGMTEAALREAIMLTGALSRRRALAATIIPLFVSLRKNS